jgi:hypothetical protein
MYQTPPPPQKRHKTQPNIKKGIHITTQKIIPNNNLMKRIIACSLLME